MTVQYVPLPLFTDADYSYSIALEGEAFIFRAYYNERATQWFFDLNFEDGTPLVLGVGLVPSYIIGLDYVLTPITGYIWLEPIGTINTEKYKEFPFELSEYYKCFYIYDDGE